MEYKLAQLICAYLLKNKTITEDLRDVYVYGFEILLSFVFSVLTILLLGLLTNNILVSLIYLIVFIFTRRFVGGYHANTHFKCQLCSFIIFSTVLLLTSYIDVDIYWICTLMVIGTFSILILAPIENPHKPITEQQHKKCKVTGLIIFLLTSNVSLLIRDFNITLCNAVFYTQAAVIVLMIKAIILKRRKQHEKEV